MIARLLCRCGVWTTPSPLHSLMHSNCILSFWIVHINGIKATQSSVFPQRTPWEDSLGRVLVPFLNGPARAFLWNARPSFFVSEAKHPTSITPSPCHSKVLESVTRNWDCVLPHSGIEYNHYHPWPEWYIFLKCQIYYIWHFILNPNLATIILGSVSISAKEAVTLGRNFKPCSGYSIATLFARKKNQQCIFLNMQDRQPL